MSVAIQQITFKRVALALAMMIVSFIAYALPTSWPNLFIVLALVIPLAMVNRHEYKTRLKSFLMLLPAWAMGAIVGYLAIGLPPN